jgi:hypothetical protein
MKIRIKGDSVRLRLMRSEVALFGERGWLEEETRLPGGTFRYRLQRDGAVKVVDAVWTGDGIVVRVPEAVAERWVTTEQVGFRESVRPQEGVLLTVLVEKDFACLDPTDEDQTDAYPNPNTTC